MYSIILAAAMSAPGQCNGNGQVPSYYQPQSYQQQQYYPPPIVFQHRFSFAPQYQPQQFFQQPYYQGPGQFARPLFQRERNGIRLQIGGGRNGFYCPTCPQ